METLKSSNPKLWNPNSVANLSLLFTPIFGAWLNAKNWQELNQLDKAKKSMLWVYFGFVFYFIILFLPDKPGHGPSTIFIIIWYLLSAKKQIKYIKDNDIDYQKKSFGKPVLIFLAGFIAFSVVVVVISSIGL